MVGSVKIVHVITKGDFGGAQTHVIELAIAQHHDGAEVAISAGSDGPAMDRARAGGVDVTILTHLGRAVAPRADVAAVRALRSVFRSGQPDIVHCHSSKGGLLARIAARRERVPSVYTAHGFPFQRAAPLVQRSLSLAGEWVGGHFGDAVICLTDEEADLARRWHIARSEEIFVVPNGLPDIQAVSRDTSNDVPAMVMVARFFPPKMQRELAAVLSTMTDIPWSITFIGDGPRFDEWGETVASTLGDRAHVLGHRDDVEELVAACDIAILWSKYEGMPIALLEAMRAGLACVASDLPGVRCLFGDPPVGLLAATDHDLEQALRRVLTSIETRRELGRAARHRFESAFTIGEMMRGVGEVYETTLKRHR